MNSIAPAPDAKFIAWLEHLRREGRLTHTPAEREKPLTVIPGGTGLGKTTLAVDFLLDDLIGRQTEIFPHAAGKSILLVPTHKVCDEKAALIRSELARRDIKATVGRWYGRARQDPTDRKRLVCQRHKAWHEVALAGGKPKKLCVGCRWRDGCYSLKQAETEADIWVAPHAVLPHAIPTPMKGADLVIIDEDPTAQLLFGVEQPRAVETADGSADPDEKAGVPIEWLRREWQGDKDEESGERRKLNSFPRANLSALFDALKVVDGAVRREAIPFSPEDAAGLVKALWSLVRRIPVDSSTTASGIKKNKSARHNRELRRVISVVEAIGHMLADNIEVSGRIQVRDGRIYISGIRPPSAGFAGMPTLLINAIPFDLALYSVWPGIDVPKQIEAAIPADVTIIQNPASAAKSKFDLQSAGKLEENTARDRASAVLNAMNMIETRAAQFAGTGAIVDGRRIDCLVVTHKALAETMIAQGLPDNVDVTWWNASRGADKWRGVGYLLVLGRPLPPARAVEAVAGALTGKFVEPVDRYERKWRYVQLRGKAGRDHNVERIEVPCHPDPIADQVLCYHCDDEQIQQIGRARAVNRTDETPLTIELVCDRAIRLPVDEVLAIKTRWDPSPVEQALIAEGGVLALRPSVMSARAKARLGGLSLPASKKASAEAIAMMREGRKAKLRRVPLFKSAKAAEDAIKRYAKDGLNILGAACLVGKACVKGQRGGRPTRVLVLPGLSDDEIRRHVSVQLGELAYLEVDGRELDLSVSSQRREP